MFYYEIMSYHRIKFFIAVSLLILLVIGGSATLLSADELEVNDRQTCGSRMNASVCIHTKCTSSCAMVCTWKKSLPSAVSLTSGDIYPLAVASPGRITKPHLAVDYRAIPVFHFAKDCFAFTILKPPQASS